MPHKQACTQMAKILLAASTRTKLSADDLLDIEYFNKKMLRALKIPEQKTYFERLVEIFKCRTR